MCFHRATFASVLSVLLWLTVATVWALDPAKPPSGNFDLSHWYLGLPVDSSGGTNGASASISTDALTNGYTSQWFYTGPDGAMTFWAWVVGATTDKSGYPRSELRELLSPPATDTNWVGYGTHILDGQCKVLQLPSTKKVIIGQIHGYTGAALPLVKVEYANGTLEGIIKTNANDDGSDFTYTFGSTGLSNSITYEIKVVNGLVTIAMNGITNSLNVFHSDPAWATNTLYFKAGDYCQDNSGPTNEGARIAFYALTVSHAPSITNQPASQSVATGSNVTFSVGALGNPPLKYIWQLNNVPINNATNAQLAIPNAQLTNAGTYSVIVTDLIGSVTSSNATLTVVAPAPLASFAAIPTSGAAPLNVAFTDTSSNSPTNWSWAFGDTGTSTLQNPGHTYTAAGVYTVRLIASNVGGSSTSTVANLVRVYDPFGWWQLQYFGSTNNNPNTAPDGDYTGTGMSNTNKFLAGFNPTNPAAYLQIINVASTNATDINVIYLGANGDNTWSPGIASRTNVLEFTAGVADGSYSTNNFMSTGQTNILLGGTGVGVVTNLVDAGGATNIPSRYYRVRVLAP
jgi:PKD repeat protein